MYCIVLFVESRALFYSLVDRLSFGGYCFDRDTFLSATIALLFSSYHVLVYFLFSFHSYKTFGTVTPVEPFLSKFSFRDSQCRRSLPPQDFLDVLDKRKETYERITEAVQAMIGNSDPTTAASLQRQLDEVKEAWEQVSSKAGEEGHKLDDALKNAEELEKQLTDMDSWLTQVHDQIVSLDHVSSVLDVLEKQRHEYKVRNKEQNHYCALYK